jgi:hypothetical protein
MYTLISLDQLHCHRKAGITSAEPYLLTAFFKIDGDTIVYGEDGLLQGRCTFVGTSGSHGDLGTSDVDVGDDVSIPSALGELGLELKRIPPDPRTNIPPEATWPGFVGVVVALMEEQWPTTDAAAAAGRVAFNRSVEQQINKIIPTLGARNPRPSDDQIAEFKANVYAAVKRAVIDNESWWRLVHPDYLIQADYFLADDDELRDDAVQEISKRFQRVVSLPPDWTSVISDDYNLTGEILGIPAGANGHQALRRSREYGTPPAAGAPAAGVLPALGRQSIVYRDSSGGLHELWRDAAGKTGATDLTAAGGAPAASGDPSVYVEDASGKLIMVFRAGDGNVHALYWSAGAVGHDDITGSIGAPRAAGDPRGSYMADGVNHVIYRSGDGHLHALWWTGGDPAGHDDLTKALAAPPAAGDPSPWADTTRGRNHVAYRATDGHVRGLYWNAGPEGHEDLSGFAGAPNAAGDPVGYYLPRHDMHQITYRGVDGHLWEVYCVGEAPAAAWDLTVSAGAPPADSDPAAYYSAASDAKHVIYRSANGHLHEIWWYFGAPPADVDLTLFALARRAAGTPAAYTVDGTSSQHVVYRSTDNEIREITWTAQLWRTAARIGEFRWCSKCQGLFYGPWVAASRCPAGDTHTPPEVTGSTNFQLPVNVPASADTQSQWRWCSKCQGLFYGPSVAASRCPAGDTHTPPETSGSSNYGLPRDIAGEFALQKQWRWCSKCQGLFYGPWVAASRCPAGDTHTPPEVSGSANYGLPY